MTKDQVREMYAGIERGDAAPFLDALADDVLYRHHGPAPHAGEHPGKAALLEVMQAVMPQIEDPKWNVEFVLAEGDDIVVVGTETFRVTATDTSAEGRFVHVLKLRDGKIVLFEDFEMAGEGAWA